MERPETQWTTAEVKWSWAALSLPSSSPKKVSLASHLSLQSRELFRLSNRRTQEWSSLQRMRSVTLELPKTYLSSQLKWAPRQTRETRARLKRNLQATRVKKLQLTETTLLISASKSTPMRSLRITLRTQLSRQRSEQELKRKMGLSWLMTSHLWCPEPTRQRSKTSRSHFTVRKWKTNQE